VEKDDWKKMNNENRRVPGRGKGGKGKTTIRIGKENIYG